MTDKRAYYDHEPAYRRIAAAGGRGWDDLQPHADDPGSYRSLRAFLDAGGAGGADRVLEIGCGGGQAAIELARRGLRVTGVDFSETAIALAQANATAAGLGIEWYVGDALALPLPDASFQLVIDNHLLHCIVAPADRARTLAEVARVLVPGGRLWSETMSFDGLRAGRYEADPVTGVAHSGTRIWVRREVLEAELAAAGLEIVELVQRPADEDGADLVTLARKS